MSLAVVVSMLGSLAALGPQDRQGGDAPAAERVVVVEALAILQLVGDGNTMRDGPHREPLKSLVKSLRERQDEAGAFVPTASPTFALDQAVATLAMAEVRIVSKFTLLNQNAVRGTSVLAVALADGPVTTEVAVFGELLLRCRRVSSAPPADLKDRIAAVPLEGETIQLAAKLAACKVQPPSTPAEVAAEHLLRRLRGQPVPKGFDASRLWPTPAASEPLATFYLELADHRPEDPAWRTASAQRAEALSSLRVRGEGDVLTWDPVGPLGKALGRDGVTSIHELSLQLCHRSCRLLCVRDL